MQTNNIKFLSYFITAIILTLGLSISLQSLMAAWTAPTASPPVCAAGDPGCDAPLNISNTAQQKAGMLVLNTGGSTNGLIVDSGNVGIGTVSPGAKLDVAGNIRLSNSIKAQGGKYITHLPWYNIGTSFTGYLKLSTPIVHNESNMFSIKIKGYEYGHGAKPVEIRCGGYAYGASTLIQTRCYTEGTDLPVEIGTETRADQGNQTVVVIRMGTPTWTAWYYSHFTAEYIGWQAKDPDDFKWVKGETTPTQSGNTNNVYIEDQSGNSYFNSGNVGIGTAVPQSQLHIGGNTNSQVSLGTISYGGSTGQAVAAIRANQGVNFGDLYFQTNGWGTYPPGSYVPTTKMVVLGTGNVGIGVDVPASKLEVAGIIHSTTGGIKFPDDTIQTTAGGVFQRLK